MIFKERKSIFVVSTAIIIIILLDNKWIGEKLYDLIQFYEKIILPLYFNVISIVKNNGNFIYAIFKYLAVVLLIAYLYDTYCHINKKFKNLQTSKSKLRYFIVMTYKMSIKFVKLLTAQLFFIYTIIYMHGKASTGYDLDKLNGAALRNAIVAYFGGGAKEAGGGGRDLGYKVILLIFVYLILSKYIVKKIKHIMILIKNHIKEREYPLKQ